MDNKNLAYEKHPKYLGYVLDPEWSSHKPIDHIVSKCRKRLSILKFIADKDWGAEAVTLRDTYLALIRPILEASLCSFSLIPSHVDIFGNEQADRLTRDSCSLLTTYSPVITYSEHQSKINRQLSKEWKIPLSHHWYAAREPGSFLDLNCDRASKTAISRLASGHTKSLYFFEGRKTFKFCSKCNVQQASA
ncbi:RNase H domain-containing protein [Trichonephila clavipes]|nr:RNase H domain-containing protein [Trichonephila clavipes]